MRTLGQRLKDAIGILTAKEDYAVIHCVTPETLEWLEDQANYQGIPAGLKFEECVAHEYECLADLGAPWFAQSIFSLVSLTTYSMVMLKVFRLIALLVSGIALFAATGEATDGVSQVTYSLSCLFVFAISYEIWYLLDRRITRLNNYEKTNRD